MTNALSYWLTPPAMEARFRNEGFARDRTVAKILLLISIFFQIVSFPTDFILIGKSINLNTAGGIRLISIVIACGIFLIVRRVKAVPVFDNIIFVWSVLLVIGIVAYGLRSHGFAPAPLLIGFVLSPMLEENFRRAMIMGQGDMTFFVGNAICIVTHILTLVLLVSILLRRPIASFMSARLMKSRRNVKS